MGAAEMPRLFLWHIAIVRDARALFLLSIVLAHEPA
jgi:hypothetical protein